MWHLNVAESPIGTVFGFLYDLEKRYTPIRIHTSTTIFKCFTYNAERKLYKPRPEVTLDRAYITGDGWKWRVQY